MTDDDAERWAYRITSLLIGQHMETLDSWDKLQSLAKTDQARYRRAIKALKDDLWTQGTALKPAPTVQAAEDEG